MTQACVRTHLEGHMQNTVTTVGRGADNLKIRGCSAASGPAGIAFIDRNMNTAPYQKPQGSAVGRRPKTHQQAHL